MSKQPRIDQMFGAVNADTFLGLPACDDIKSTQAAVAILGVPVMTPYRSIGSYCTQAPRAIREVIAPYSANIKHMDFDLGRPIFPDGNVCAVDCGDLPYDEDDFAANRTALETRVAEMLDANAVPVLIGGDDSVPIPMFEAFAGRGDFTILQIDAHIDWRDEVDGERFGLSSNMRRAAEMPHIKNIIQVGQRAIGSGRPGDYQDALAWGVQFVPARQVEAHGIAPIIERITPGSNVIIALDIDGLDPSVVPGVIGRAPGGLSYWQAVGLIHGVCERANLCAFNLVEFMPGRDVDEIGALVAARLVVNVIGCVAGTR